MSGVQPLCDGSHKGTAFKPLEFTIEEPVKTLELCGCKFTTSVPYCDGVGCKRAKSFYDNLEKVQKTKKEIDNDEDEDD